SYATFKKQWPGMDFIVTSPPLSYEEYPNEERSKEYLLSMMVGDLQRIKEYPAKGFQIEQEIPDDVWQAYEQLVREGYTTHLIRDSV
ncbi:MAG TPA: YdcF family protein, partial [Candidatus Paceibacterota bacterium]|nr:YdcF family protein [Candidatus Paceibacterota bacterium]